MSNRSWFYASNGQQQGPFPEAQLRDLITRGTVRADTLVWSEGMAGWQKAADCFGKGVNRASNFDTERQEIRVAQAYVRQDDTIGAARK